MTGRPLRAAGAAAPPGRSAGSLPAGADRLIIRLEARLAAKGHPWPAFATLLIVTRARRRLDRLAFGALVGIDVADVIALEEGEAHPAVAPMLLATLVPEVDWWSVVADALGPGRPAGRERVPFATFAASAGPASFAAGMAARLATVTPADPRRANHPTARRREVIVLPSLHG
jgi:hypothetical protein